MDKNMGSGSGDDITDHGPLKNPAQQGKDWRKNVEMLSGKKKKAKNVLTRMEAYAERGGPFSLLSRCVKEKLKIKVWTRSYKHVRGICTGFLVAYDRHMNLAMYDVDEVYKNPVPLQSEKKKPRKRIRKKKLHATTVKAEISESLNEDQEEIKVNTHMDITPSSVAGTSTTKQVIKREIHMRNEASMAEKSDALAHSARSSKNSSRHIDEIKLEPLDLSVDRSVEEETVCSADNASTSKTVLVSNSRDFVLNSDASGSNINTETKSLKVDNSAINFESLFCGEMGKDTNSVMKRMEVLSCSEAVTCCSSSSISACTSIMSDISSTSSFIPPTGSSDSSVTCITSCAVTTLNESVNSLATSRPIFTSSHTSGSKDLTVLSHIPGSSCSTSSVLSADNKNFVTSLDISHPDSKTREPNALHDQSISVKTGEVLSSDVVMHGEISETGEGSEIRTKFNKDVKAKQESIYDDVVDDVVDNVDDVDDTSDADELMNEMKNIRAALEALDSSSDSNHDLNDDDSNYNDDFNYDDDEYSDNCSASDNDSYDLYNQFHDNVDSDNDNNNNDNERRESSYSNRDFSSFNQQPGHTLCTSGKNSSIEKLVALASNQQTGNSDAASFSGKSSEQAKDRKKQLATRGSATTSDEKDSELRKDNPYALSMSSFELSKGRKKQSATKSDKKDLELWKNVDTETEEREIEDTECEEGEIVSEEETEEIKEDKSRIATSGKNVKREKAGASDSRKHIDNNKARNDRQLKKDTSRVQELRQDHCDRKGMKSSVDYNRNSKVLPDGQGSTRRQSGVKDARDRNQSREESQKFDCDKLGRRNNSASRRNDIRGNTSKIDDTNMNWSKNSKVTAGKADETNFRSNRGKDRSSTITAESLGDRLRGDSVDKGSVRRNEERYEAVLTRHVNQLFIRGDNVVMIAVASITD